MSDEGWYTIKQKNQSKTKSNLCELKEYINCDLLYKVIFIQNEDFK